MHTTTHTHLIKSKARELGFDYCGVARAVQLQQEARDLEKWLSQGRHGSMGYMENHFEKRIDPRKLVEGAQSVITLLLNYYPEKQLDTELKISKYAYGRDYHKVIKSKLKKLLAYIREAIGEVHGRGFVDSAPVMDKAWAKRAGLGWVGKHTNLIHPKAGSFYFIAELIVDLELEYDGPIKDYCGTCTKCLDACPTDALTAPYEIDGSKCISYLTIELKENIPSSFKNQFDGWAFGCDICQDVCPWNRFATSTKEPDFQPHPKLEKMNTKAWTEITEELFEQLFKGSAVKRTRYEGLKRNIRFLTEE